MHMIDHLTGDLSVNVLVPSKQPRNARDWKQSERFE